MDLKEIEEALRYSIAEAVRLGYKIYPWVFIEKKRGRKPKRCCLVGSVVVAVTEICDELTISESVGVLLGLELDRVAQISNGFIHGTHKSPMTRDNELYEIAYKIGCEYRPAIYGGNE